MEANLYELLVIPRVADLIAKLKAQIMTDNKWTTEAEFNENVDIRLMKHEDFSFKGTPNSENAISNSITADATNEFEVSEADEWEGMVICGWVNYTLGGNLTYLSVKVDKKEYRFWGKAIVASQDSPVFIAADPFAVRTTCKTKFIVSSAVAATAYDLPLIIGLKSCGRPL